jgi:hypothetical protein
MIVGLLLSVAFTSCKKNDINPNSQITSDAIWVTPNGKVIPYSEKDNWREYEVQNFQNSREKAEGPKKRILSYKCTTENNLPGLLCKKVVTRWEEECTKVSPCTWCPDCTPTKKVYNSTEVSTSITSNSY